MNTLGIAIIGCGGITLQNHLPGLALCADTQRHRAVRYESGDAGEGQPRHGDRRDFHELRGHREARRCARGDHRHAECRARADRARGHRRGQTCACEKPLAMNYAEAQGHGRRGGCGGRAAHDGVHLSLRAGDALPRASHRARRSRRSRIITARAGCRIGARAISAGVR